MATTQRTFGIVKPDATAAGNAGKILACIEESGLKIIAMKLMHLSEAQAKGFYAVHKERPFFGELVTFMTEGPIVAVVMEGENAIQRWRDLMGPTNSDEAPAGTIRGDFGSGIERNASHGSDAPETAALEISYFFNATEIQAPTEAL
ncbi:MAG: nucleoside-diphosphate kinase [Myxococcota bacterium]|jgi:nucleoside-diphosphate kinase